MKCSSMNLCTRLLLYCRVLSAVSWCLCQKIWKSLIPTHNTLITHTLYTCSPDSIINIGTCYRLDVQGFEPRWRQDCPHPSRLDTVLTQPLVQWVPHLFPGRKAARVWRRPPTHFSCQGCARVQLYLCLPFVWSQHVIEWYIHFTLHAKLHGSPNFSASNNQTLWPVTNQNQLPKPWILQTFGMIPWGR